jgi:hypothetical protein
MPLVACHIHFCQLCRLPFQFAATATAYETLPVGQFCRPGSDLRRSVCLFGACARVPVHLSTCLVCHLRLSRATGSTAGRRRAGRRPSRSWMSGSALGGNWWRSCWWGARAPGSCCRAASCRYDMLGWWLHDLAAAAAPVASLGGMRFQCSALPVSCGWNEPAVAGRGWGQGK